MVLKKIAQESQTLPKYLKYIFSSKKRAIYIGCLGHHNIGDDAVYKAIKSMIKSKVVLYAINYNKVNKGAKLRKLYFSYPDYIIIGGGTIIKKKATESYLRLILNYHQKYPKAQLLTLGTGVADPILAKQIGFSTEVEAWTTILNKCSYISVRGPLSKTIISNDWNVTTPVEILFDPALYFKQTKAQKSKQKTIGVNFCNIVSRIYGLDQKKVDFFAKSIVQKLLDDSWKVILFPTTGSDLAYMKMILGEEIFKNVLKHTDSKNIEKSLRFFDTIDVFLGMRLHSILFSALKSTPFYAIEYEQKTSDFLQSIALENSQIRTDELDVEKVFSEINIIYSNLEEQQNKLLSLVSKAKNKQEQTVKDFLKTV